MRRHSIASVIAVGLLLAAAAGAGAQSPSPIPAASSPVAASSSAPSSPGAPGDLTCEDLAGLLPRSLSSWPGHTQVLDMDMDLVLRAFNGHDPSPIDEDGQIEMVGPGTFHATYREEVPCGDGPTETLEGDGGGAITSIGVAYVTSDFADEGMITLQSFETDDFHITDRPCPQVQAFDQDGSLGPRITQCDPDGDFLTGMARGIRGHAEERDGAYGFSFDCTDTGGDDSVKLTVTMSGFLAGASDVPGP